MSSLIRVIPVQATEDGKTGDASGVCRVVVVKTVYHYVIKDWLKGDSAQPEPPGERLKGE